MLVKAHTIRQYISRKKFHRFSKEHDSGKGATSHNILDDEISPQTLSGGRNSKQNPGVSSSGNKKFKSKAQKENTNLDILEARKRASKKREDELFAQIQLRKANSAVKNKRYIEAIKFYEESLSHTFNKKILLDINISLADINIIVMNLAETSKEQKIGYGESAIASFENAIDLISKGDPNDPRIKSIGCKLGNILFSMEKYDDAYLQYSIANENLFKPDPDSSSNQPVVLMSDETEGRKIDESVTQNKSFEEWKNIYIFRNPVQRKGGPFHVEAETLVQMMYNCAMLAFNNKVYSVVTANLLDVYRYKISSPDPVPHIPEFDIIYYLGKSYLYSNKKYWAAVLLENFLKKFDHDHPNAEDYDDGLVHTLLGGMYSHTSNSLALMHYFEYLSGSMDLPTQNPRMVIHFSIEKFKDKSEVVNIFKRMGDLFLEDGDYYIAAHNLREVYNTLEMTEEYPEELLGLLQKIYVCYDKLHTLEGKIWVLKQLVERIERMINVGCDLSTDDLAAHSKELGELLHKKRNACESSIIYLNKFLKFAKPDNPSIAKTKNKIARTHYLLGDMDRALDTCIDAEKSALSLKEGHLRVRILCLKGSIYARKKQRMEFINAFQEALKLKRIILGEDQLHVDVANILYIYGTRFYYFDNYKECVDCFLEAFSILVLNDKLNNKCVEALKGAVRGYREMKFYISALTTCKKILELLPKQSDKTASTLELMGDIHYERGGWSNKVNAAELYRESACVFRKYQSRDSEKVLNLYKKMASIYMLIDENDMSMNTFKVVVKSYKVSHNNGEKPMVLLEALEGQGSIYFKNRRYKLALQRYENTIRLIDKFEAINLGSIQREKMEDLRIVLLLKIGRTRSRTMDYVSAVESLSKGFKNLSSGSTKQYLVSTIACYYLYEFGLAWIGMGDDNLAKENFQKAFMILQHITDLKEDNEELKINIYKELQALKQTNCNFNLTQKVLIVLSRARKFVIHWLFC